MLYTIARPIARYVLGYYFRHIDITGLEHIPASGPVILAANHPTAFIEPCLLACYQNRRLWFLARGNLFKNRLATTALNGLNILPVYRIKDGGYGKLKDNYATFAACYRALGKGKAIMILAEGRTIHEKKLRVLRKGTGRIAMGALIEHPELETLPIVPIGVNFTKGERMRSTVMIRCGEPIDAKDYLAAFKTHETKAIRALTEDLRLALDPLVVQVATFEQNALAEGAFTLAQTEQAAQLKYGLTHEGTLLDHQLQLTKRLPKDATAIERYFNRLHHLGLSDPAVAGIYQTDFKRGWWGWLKTLVALLILLWHLPLWFLGEYIGGTSTQSIEFYSPVRFAAIAIGLVVYPLLWLLSLNYWLVAYALIAVFGINWAWYEWEATKRWSEARMAWRQIPDERSYLQALRQAALATIKQDA